MKRLIILFSVLIVHSIYAQKMPSDYFVEAEKFLEEDNLESALSIYQFIVDNYPRNELYPRALFNTGYIYLLQKNYVSSISIFMNILNSNFNEKEILGGNIMDDPFTNYKHRSSALLSDIYYANNMYDSALYYLVISDTIFPYYGFCGNEQAENEIYKSIKYSDIYQKLNQPDKAIESLLPNVFNTLANNTKVISELKNLLSRKKNVKKELDKSISSIYSREFSKNNKTYKKYYFKFLNVEILVPDGYEDDNIKFDIQISRKEILQSTFYQMVDKM